MKSIVLLVAVITVCVIFTEARPNGAPSSSCSDFVPRHLPNQATGPVPYDVNVTYCACIQSSTSIRKMEFSYFKKCYLKLK